MTRGVVYTPEFWADWAVEEFDIAERWMAGSIVLDPGCGAGALSEAVIKGSLRTGFRPSDSDLRRLMGMDRDRDALREYRKRIRERYGLELPEVSAKHGDYLLQPPDSRADVILGNPPWVTFGDLSSVDKDSYRPVFRASGLTPDARHLLLGGSRIDVAALFVVVGLERDLRNGGEAHYFLPMSLFRNEGAHEAFRRLALPSGRSCALTGIRELDGGPAFPGAGTRFGLATFRAGGTQSWPIPWLRAQPNGGWERREARPVDGTGSPLISVPPGTEPLRPPRIPVPPGTRPRQGANAGGASEAFIVTRTGPPDDGAVPVMNARGVTGRLPESRLHPLMDRRTFTGSEDRSASPERWIFLPYDSTGRILEKEELSSEPGAADWLEIHRAKLMSRKGPFLKRLAGRGYWWGMLGVGTYAFAPWKIAWEAYGRDRLVPRLFDSRKEGHWQGNQALHAYLPFDTEQDAQDALIRLGDPDLTAYLRELGGAHTKGWAQPGRIRRLLVSSE